MKVRLAITIAAAAAALVSSGCVERMLLIRSAPAGAPVYIDEAYVGNTPAVVPFSHYGVRRIRVGPVRDEKDSLLFAEQEREVRVTAPWYEVFPLDFFAEVLWPATVRDLHEATFTLQAPEESSVGEQAARDALSRAEAFRAPVTPAAEPSD